MGRRKPSEKRLAVGYIRASTSRQELGPEDQEAAIRAWCAEHHVELLEPLHHDDGMSGGLDLEDRPGLVAAVTAAEEHGAGMLVVHKRDRLARDADGAGHVAYLLRRHGCVVHATDRPYVAGEDPDPMLLAMVQMQDVFAQLELALIRARTKAALGVKRKRGERISGKAPFGYRFDGGRVVPHPREQRTVKLILELREQGHSLRSICRELQERGHKPRGRAWYSQVVAAVVKRGGA